jgi:hypothetical protein
MAKRNNATEVVDHVMAKRNHAPEAVDHVMAKRNNAAEVVDRVMSKRRNCPNALDRVMAERNGLPDVLITLWRMTMGQSRDQPTASTMKRRSRAKHLRPIEMRRQGKRKRPASHSRTTLLRIQSQLV